MNNVSVCTIYANRKTHLQNLVRGLNSSSIHPDRLVVVCMNDRLPELPATPFPIATATIATNDNLPLAAARNKAASIATGEKLIFLDVDCICDRHLIEIFDYHLEREDALYVGSVSYLHDGWRREAIYRKGTMYHKGIICEAVPLYHKGTMSEGVPFRVRVRSPLGQQNWTLDLSQHSSFNQLQGMAVTGKNRVTHPYELFWSLCFAIRKETFDRIGGFDPDYTGYGAEDTDFSFTARSQEIPLYKTSALAYHQFHPSYAPPLNHLKAIVNNAKVFYRKWNTLPMEKWLHQFADLGYISGQNDCIEIIKLPTPAEIAACKKNV